MVFLLCLRLNFSRSIKVNILISSLIFSAIIVALVELLSLFKSLNLISIAAFWGLFSLSLLYFLIKDHKKSIATLVSLKYSISLSYSRFNLFEKIIVWFVIACFSILLFQGIIYPPNNWDSLTYHMTRIMFWLGNESVEHFPTHILRHLYQPALTEYYILNINILNGNDYFSNSVQLFFLGLTIISVWTLLDWFKINWYFKLLGAFLVITIPSVLLQATTTKNDIVCSFFIITSVYFCLKSYYYFTFKNFIFLGASIGLAFFTKGTSYLFLMPILLVFGFSVLLKIFKDRSILVLLKGLIAILIILIINFSLYLRNFKINGNVLNIDEIESKMYSNDQMNLAFFISNLLKNSGLHLGYPIGEQSDRIIRDFHKKLEVDINSPKTNYFGTPYEGAVKISTHEDLVANFMPFLLIFICFITLIINGISLFRHNKLNLLLGLVILLQILVFTVFLKWQPWHTRLHIPIFLLSVPLIIVTSQRIKWYRYLLLFSLPFLVYGFFFYSFYNRIRPLSQNKSYTVNVQLSDDRYKKYFANQLHLYPDYATIAGMMYTDAPKKIGVSLSDWEYPLFTNFYYNKVKIVTLNVNNSTAKIPQDLKEIDIIVTNYNQDFIEINGTKYLNQTPNQKFLYYYKK